MIKAENKQSTAEGFKPQSPKVKDNFKLQSGIIATEQVTLGSRLAVRSIS